MTKFLILNSNSIVLYETYEVLKIITCLLLQDAVKIIITHKVHSFGLVKLLGTCGKFPKSGEVI